MLGNAKKATIKRSLNVLLNYVRRQQGEEPGELVAAREERVVASTNAVLDATGTDVQIEYDREQRAVDLVDGIEELIGGDFPSWWIETQSGLENADVAAEWAATDEDEWNDHVETKADELREAAGLDEDVDDRDLMDQHLQNVHGVGIDDFERLVVDIDVERAADEFLAGPINTCDALLHRLADRLEEHDLDVDLEDDAA